MQYSIKRFLVPVIFMVNVLSAFDGDYTFQLVSADQATINSIVHPKQGMMIFNTTDRKVYFYDAVNWINVDKPILSSDANNTLSTGSDGGVYFPTVNVLTKTVDYTLTIDDNSAVLRFDTISDVTLTIPSGLPVGFNVSIYQVNTGKVLIAAGAGVTVKNRLLRFKTAGIDAGAGIVSTAANTFHITGDLKQ
jgi:hypothetical protein